MSSKGTPSACNSKQIPRIFRNRRGLCSVRSLPQGEICIVADSLAGYCKSNLLTTTLEEDEDKEQDVANKKEQYKTRTDENISEQYGVWNEDNQSVTVDSSVDEIDKTADVETVADIEKWLKTRTESVSSMDLKSEEGVDQYLGEELQHDFLAKDHDGLSIDIDLSDKKLNLGYDPLLHALQDEKDNFILPEFQLDHLDPMALSPDDMMVAGEILPSTSVQPILTVPGTDVEEICSDTEQASLMKIVMIPDNQELQDKSLQVVDDLHDIHNVNKEIQLEKDSNLSENNTNLYVQDLTAENAIQELSDEKLVKSNSESVMIEQLKAKAKVKLEPRIIKKRKKTRQTIEKKLDGGIKISGDNTANSEDDVMAVVAISTDKISNMTQIVINTGTGEQIYQGKTSELIEATGNIPTLPKIETATVWDGTVEFNTENSSNHHETVTSNALIKGELSITDDIDNLQPVSVNEHGKVWQCPQADCNREFSKLHLLKDHLLAHYGIKPFKCDFEGCAWGFYSEFRLKRHKETHLKRKDYVCEIEGCNRRFTTVYNLWSHTKLHSRPNRIPCQVPDCEEKFQTKRALELHMKSHDQSHAPYVCKHEGCGKRYYSSNALTSHQRCHSYKDVDVKCSWPGCGKVFDKPCRLKAHIRSHTGCKPYLCTFPDCHWAFSSSSKLKRHQKKHTNERKFVCDVPSCGKAFMRSEHLKEHRLTHKEGRCFQCLICNAQFSAKSSLYVHIKKHQVKEDAETNQQETLGNQNKRDKVKEPQCSRVNPVPKSKRKSIDLNINAYLNMSTVTAGKSEAVDAILGNNNENQIEDDATSQDQSKTVYYCPVETCTRSYITKARLRAHMLKIHGTSVEESDNTSKNEDSDCNKDYILYTVPSTSEPTEPTEMIMVGPCDCDTVIVSTASETNCYLPEPSNTNVAKQSEPSDNTIQKQSRVQNAKKDHGSARTDLTFTDVWKLKTNGALFDSVVGTTDVVLGTSDVEEGLLLTDELPSMYYQDEVAGTEYQVLLLDPVPSESTINLRGLE